MGFGSTAIGERSLAVLLIPDEGRRLFMLGPSSTLYTKNEHKDLPCALPYVPLPPRPGLNSTLWTPSPSLMEPRMPSYPIVKLVQEKFENQGMGWRAVTRPTISISRNWKLSLVAAKLFPKT